MPRRRLAAVGVGLALALIGGVARAEADAGRFLLDLSERAIQKLTEPGIADDEKRRRFRVLMNEAFGIAEIGRFVLGRFWSTASEAERQDFIAIFEDSMVSRFLPLFADYTGEKLTIGVVRQFGDNPNFFNVSAHLRRVEGEPIMVDWRMRRSADRYEILDVIVEGVSIAVTLRAEYGSFLKQHNGDVSVLNRALRDKLARP